MIRLGFKVRDVVTGFEGIATSRTEYLNGCIRYFVERQELDPNGKCVSEHFDAQQLEIVDQGIVSDRPVLTSTGSGGPQRNAPPRL